MSPSATVALVLLGLWVLMMFAVTNATGADQRRSRDTTPSEPMEYAGSESAPPVSDD